MWLYLHSSDIYTAQRRSGNAQHSWRTRLHKRFRPLRSAPLSLPPDRLSVPRISPYHRCIDSQFNSRRRTFAISSTEEHRPWCRCLSSPRPQTSPWHIWQTMIGFVELIRLQASQHFRFNSGPPSLCHPRIARCYLWQLTSRRLWPVRRWSISYRNGLPWITCVLFWEASVAWLACMHYQRCSTKEHDSCQTKIVGIYWNTHR